MSFDIKQPISMYQGIRKQINNDNIGRSYFATNLTYDYRNNNTILTPFSRIFLNTTLGSVTLKLPDLNLEPGDIIRLIDVKKTFLTRPLELDPQSQKLNHQNTTSIFTMSGSIIDVVYISEEVGWLTFIGGELRSDSTNFIEYNIGPSEVGDRTGMVVSMTKTAHTVQLASTTSLNRVPVLGVIRKDKMWTVLTQTHNIDIVEVQLDSNSVNPQPKEFLFLSDEAGYLTNIAPYQGIIHKLGIIKEVISEKVVIANFFPNPEYILDMCEVEEEFTSKEIVELDAGDGFQVYLDTTGHMWTQGVNNYGQLGLTNMLDRSDPTKVKYPCPVSDVACGDYHTLSIDLDYNIWAMGRNNYGQLGVGDKIDASSPTKLMVEE